MGHELLPSIGPNEVDHFHPGSNRQWPTWTSSRSTVSTRTSGKSRTWSASANVFTWSRGIVASLAGDRRSSPSRVAALLEPPAVLGLDLERAVLDVEVVREAGRQGVERRGAVGALPQHDVRGHDVH